MDVDDDNDMLARVAAGDTLELYVLFPQAALTARRCLLTEAGMPGLRCRLTFSRAWKRYVLVVKFILREGNGLTETALC